jgi:hypothetical protein
LEGKDAKNIEEMVDHLHPEIKMKHCVSLFMIIAKKIQDRE